MEKPLSAFFHANSGCLGLLRYPELYGLRRLQRQLNAVNEGLEGWRMLFLRRDTVEGHKQRVRHRKGTDGWEGNGTIGQGLLIHEHYAVSLGALVNGGKGGGQREGAAEGGGKGGVPGKQSLIDGLILLGEKQRLLR